MSRVESIRFNGVTFRRYPDSKSHSERSYFTPGIADKQRGIRRLHEEIWIAANGSIPPGHDIHHVDGNSLNNDVSNLQLLTEGDHQHIHAEQRKREGFYSTPAKLAHLERIQPLTKVWHGSVDGKAWHAEHGRATWKNRETHARTCTHCGRGYRTRTQAESKFCSSKCRSGARYASGVDNVDRVCVICNATFSINRYLPAVSCSRQCGRKWREIKKKLNS